MSEESRRVSRQIEHLGVSEMLPQISQKDTLVLTVVMADASFSISSVGELRM